MADPDRAIAPPGPAPRLGLRLSVDDFGTGYSSLTHLQRLPVDEVKIDRTFVTSQPAASTSPSSGPSPTSGRHLGLRVAAEGVEDEATSPQPAQMGCDSAQGYWQLARPMPAVDFLPSLAELPDEPDRHARRAARRMTPPRGGAVGGEPIGETARPGPAVPAVSGRRCSRSRFGALLLGLGLVVGLPYRGPRPPICPPPGCPGGSWPWPSRPPRSTWCTSTPGVRARRSRSARSRSSSASSSPHRWRWSRARSSGAWPRWWSIAAPRSLKVTFNLALHVAEASVAVAVFRTLTAPAGRFRAGHLAGRLRGRVRRERPVALRRHRGRRVPRGRPAPADRPRAPP